MGGQARPGHVNNAFQVIHAKDALPLYNNNNIKRDAYFLTDEL